MSLSKKLLVLISCSIALIGCGGSGENKVRTEVNEAPQAAVILINTDENTSKIINLSTYISDADGDVLTIAAIGSPIGGATLEFSGLSMTYTPNGFTGNDEITYTVTDGTNISSASLIITSSAVNQAPQAADILINTDENTSKTINLSTYVSDADGDVLTISAIGSPIGGATLEFSGLSMTYTPNGFTGNDEITYTVTDGTNISSASLIITSSGLPAIGLPAIISDLDIIGNWSEGQTLQAIISCTECLPEMHEYNWTIEGVSVSNTDSYVLIENDLDKEIRIEVSANNNENLADTADEVIVAGSNKVEKIYSSWGAFAALKTDGSVVTWGDNNNGANSNSVDLNNVSEIYSTYQSFAALKTDGSVVTWGHPYYGGDSSTVELNNVIRIYSNNMAFAALKNDGSVVTWGDGATGGDSSAVELNNVTRIHSNTFAFAALKTDGTVVSWGDSNMGGDSSSVELNSIADIYSTGYAFAALKTDGSVVTWGASNMGGDSSTVELNSVVKIYSNGSAFTAVTNNGSGVTWGDNSNGADSSAIELNNITAIYSTDRAFAALKTDGSLMTWGYSDWGGDSSAVDLNNVEKIYSNSYAFAALKTDGSVVTWGNLADPTYTYGEFTIAGDLSSISEIYHSGGAFAAIKNDGSVVTWGYDDYGADTSTVELNNVDEIFSCGTAFAALKTDGTVVTWGVNEMGGDSSTVANDLLPSTTNIVASKETDSPSD